MQFRAAVRVLLALAQFGQQRLVRIGYDGSDWPHHDGLKWPHCLVAFCYGMVVSA